jgi:hypothetical protein
VEFLLSFFPPTPSLVGPIVEVIEDEELGEDDDEAISSTATTLLSEEEYQEFLNEGQSGTCDAGQGAGVGGGVEEVTSASSDAPKDKASTAEDDGGDGSAVEEKSEVEDKEEQKKQEVEGEKTAPKEEEIHNQDEKEEGGVEKTDEKATSEETQPDENRDGGNIAVETSQDQPKEDGEKEKDASVDAEVKGDHDSSSERPPPAGSALERRMTAYGRSRAASVSLQRRLSGMSSAHPSEPTGPGHVWDHVMLNCPQFVQLIELYLGPDPEDATVDALSSFIRNNYSETVQV